ncbi:uncharacterized protein LOC130985829 [Salvia miltiorrhiza]|uniref:uncharacterized protein LOC130985829 n=1 Tax=Salvia miltiorrhiza TaxID=226208 RepID=UPI0025ABFF25|nr:uncharacterized protein LOC130985829 [Salvia miltiorrhiza]XP_057764961.1 uncharacterized protein LOC130985829 [Salvia miltiorrhiza]
MDGVDRAVRRPSLKERLGLKGLGCCGPTWGLGPTTMSVRDDEEEEEDGPGAETETVNAAHNPIQSGPMIPPCVAQSPGMNLAAALAAERQLRAALEFDIGGGGLSPRARASPGNARRVSLMRLLEETDGCGDGRKEGESDWVCCVCMGRKKGAAFIPCGHTFCRVCSRELWLNRGSCPLCNRSILEILDIY